MVADNYMTAIQQTAVSRATAVDQMYSTKGTVGSDVSGLSANVVNGMNVCNMSAYSGSVNIVHPCSDSVNAGFVLYANNTELNEIILPTFTDSTS
jgi:hypothetical protein